MVLETKPNPPNQKTLLSQFILFGDETFHRPHIKAVLAMEQSTFNQQLSHHSLLKLF